jgi:hypothetical protein
MTKQRKTARRPHFRLSLEALEDRTLLSVSVIEGFEGGSLAAYQTALRYAPSAVILPIAAHDGYMGLVKQDGYEWMIRNDAATQVHSGDTVSVWTQFAGTADGRAYLGFDAHDNGTFHSPLTDGGMLSVVMAANTSQLLIQNNAGFNEPISNPSSAVAATAQSYVANHWYRLEASWSGASVTARLYDSDGITLLSSVSGSTTAPFPSGGGIAFRAFGHDKYFDTVVLDAGSTGTVAQRGSAGGGLGAGWTPGNPPPPVGNNPGGGPAPVPWQYTSTASSGRDVSLAAFNDLQQVSPGGIVGGTVGLAAMNNSAVGGTQQIGWGPPAFGRYNSGIPLETPLLAQYIFRQLPGQPTRLIGSSDLKHFFSSAHTDTHHLNPGENDTYGSGLNQNQTLYTDGSEMDPVTGQLHSAVDLGHNDPDNVTVGDNLVYSSAIQHLLQVNVSDLNPATNPVGTRWFLMGNLFVAGDQDVTNNSRWVEITPHFNGTMFTFTYPAGSTGTANFRTIPGLTGVLNVPMTPADNLIIRADPTNSNNLQVVNAITSAVLGEYIISGLTNIVVTCDSNPDTLTVDYHYGDPLPFGGLNYQFGPGVDTLNVNDTFTSTGQTFTLTGTSVQRSGSAPITFTSGGINFVNVNGGSGNNTYKINNSEAGWTTTVNTGTGSDLVNVLGLTTLLNVNCQGGSGTDVVNVGNAGSLPGIAGTLNLENEPSYTTVNINDQADGAAHTAVIDTVTRFGDTSLGRLTGIGSAVITWDYYDTSAVNINFGSGTTTVNVLGTGVPTNLFNNGLATVNIGNANSIAGIQGVLNLENEPNFDTVNINDQADADAHTAVIDTVTRSGDTSLGRLTGIAAAITWDYLDTSAVNINFGSGTTTVNVLGTGVTTNLFNNAAATVNIGNANSIAGIQGVLNLENEPNFDIVNINDQADADAHTAVIDTVTRSGDSSLGRLTGISTGAITWDYRDTTPVNINFGSGTTTVNVLGTGVPTNLFNNGLATVNVGNANSLSGILGALTLNNSPSFSHVNLQDGADNAGHPNVGISTGGVTGLAPVPINFSTSPVCIDLLTITVGNGNNAYTITGSQAYLGTTLNTGGGTDIVSVQGAAYPLTVNSAGGSGADTIKLGDTTNTLTGINGAVTVTAAGTDTLNVNDQGTVGNRNYTVSATTVSWTGGTTVSYTGLGALNLNGGNGIDTYFLNGTSATAALVATGVGGSNTVTGSNSGNIWTLVGINAGSLAGAAYATPATFFNMANLTAGSGGDRFSFTDGAAITGHLAGGGSDTLDYTPYTTSVMVDLLTGVATAVGGGVSGILGVFGASGAPGTPGLFNLVIGNGGGYLQGGTGRRNLLVTGGAAGTLVGGDGEDLLIAGSTAYDTDPSLAAWQVIAAYWVSGDPFPTRVANLLSGNGVPILDPTPVTGNVFGNGGGNTLSGIGGVAAIFTDGADTIGGFDPSSQTIPIAP